MVKPKRSRQLQDTNVTHNKVSLRSYLSPINETYEVGLTEYKLVRRGTY